LTPVSTNSAAAQPTSSWQRWALRGGVTGLLLAVSVQVGWLVLANNFHVVLPGAIYRSSQLSEADLERAVRRHGIRTVVNLRGICFGCAWYEEECRATHRCNVSQEDVGFSAGRLPPIGELRHLVRVLDQSEYPILIHCRQGVDRTGLVSTLVLLLYTETDLRTARRQLGLSYGHVPIGRTLQMFRFFDLYETWLSQQGLKHTQAVFRRWLEREYTPGPASARLELLEVPDQVPPGRPWSVRVRARNTSGQTWRLQPGSTAGVHCGYVLTNQRGTCLIKGRAGLFRAEVPPGESIDLTLALPAVPQAGPCYLMVDMLDEEQQCWFYQNGSDPLLHEVRVGP